MRQYTCTQCGVEFSRKHPATGTNAFCSKECRSAFSAIRKDSKNTGFGDQIAFRQMIAKGETKYIAALAASGKRFEDADVPAEGHFNVMKPETIVAGYGTTAAWSTLPGSASGRDDKQMREFPEDISVAPLRSLGAA